MAPELTEITAVKNPTNNTTPPYSFGSSERGRIDYGGGCKSDQKEANEDQNTINFKKLPEGDYEGC